MIKTVVMVVVVEAREGNFERHEKEFRLYSIAPEESAKCFKHESKMMRFVINENYTHDDMEEELQERRRMQEHQLERRLLAVVEGQAPNGIVWNTIPPPSLLRT